MSKGDHDKKNNGEICVNCAGNVFLRDSIFGDNQRDEIREINKHDIIIKICEIIGPSPLNLCKAEKIFDLLRVDIANYVIHHEYNSPNGISSDLILWLDSRINPTKAQALSDFLEKYIK